jgi:hypothetical protein
MLDGLVSSNPEFSSKNFQFLTKFCFVSFHSIPKYFPTHEYRNYLLLLKQSKPGRGAVVAQRKSVRNQMKCPKDPGFDSMLGQT